MSDSTLSPDAPPPARPATNGEAAMSTSETLANIFFEPGRTFAALRERPRFLVAGLIIIALMMLTVILLFQRIDFVEVIRQQMERQGSMSPQQIEQALNFYRGPIGRAAMYALPLLVGIVIIAGGAALYMLGAMLMGGKLSYKQALSVWVYSSFPPSVLATLIGVVVLFLKAPEDVDPTQSDGGLVIANLGALLSADSSPVMRALLGSIDLLAFYGLFLAAVGLQRVGRLPSGAAWSVVIGLYVLKVVLKMGRAIAFG